MDLTNFGSVSWGDQACAGPSTQGQIDSLSEQLASLAKMTADQFDKLTTVDARRSPSRERARFRNDKRERKHRQDITTDAQASTETAE